VLYRVFQKSCATRPWSVANEVLTTPGARSTATKSAYGLFPPRFLIPKSPMTITRLSEAASILSV
jgi:hypothetical protein